MKELVGRKEQRDIELLVDRILRDLGHPEPPLDLAVVRQVLSLDMAYYSSTDAGPFAEFAHKIRVAGKNLSDSPGLLLDVLKKANLSGLWIPDTRKILIHQEVPKLKHRWIEAHEVTHSFIPWHNEFLLGDNEETLDPNCHAIIEAEANFGAGRLLFFGKQFGSEARDLPIAWESIEAMRNRYRNSLTSTFWRFVEDRDPNSAIFGLVSQHPRYPEIGQGPNGEKVRKFVTSEGFRLRFPNISANDAYEVIARNASWKKRGPVIGGHDVITDGSGVPVKFALEGFSNSYQVLTLGWTS